MEALAYAQVDLLSLLTLLICFIAEWQYGENHQFEAKIFLAMVCCNGFQLLMDGTQWLLDGVPGSVARAGLLTTSALCFVGAPVAGFFWVTYVLYQVFRDRNRIREVVLPLLVPCAVNAALALLSLPYGLEFSIDAANGYHRGPFYGLLFAICYLYLIFPNIIIFRNRKRLGRRAYLSLLLFSVPPMAAGVLQGFFYGLSLVWGSLTLSLLIVFVNMQSNYLYTDYLTGLQNRRHLDRRLREWLSPGGNSSALIGAVMVDLDKFKQINDRFGHETGDLALMEAGKLLRRSFRKEDVICRYGGDEFVVVLKAKDKAEVRNAVKRLQANVQRFNTRRGFPVPLEFSIGYDVCDSQGEANLQRFLKHIDDLMYADKHKKRQERQEAFANPGMGGENRDFSGPTDGPGA